MRAFGLKLLGRGLSGVSDLGLVGFGAYGCEGAAKRKGYRNHSRSYTS